MASPAVLLSKTEAELKNQVAKVNRLEAECKEKKNWLDAGSAWQASKAKPSWDAAERLLKAAQDEKAALRRSEEILLGKLDSPGEV